MLCFSIGLLVAVACASATGLPQESDTRGQQIRSLLDRDIPQLLIENGVPSVSIAHIENGRIIFAAAYGFQSPGVPATTRTLYNIASMTKPISAEVILRLASADRLSLDEPMYRYWIDPDIAQDERRKLLTPRLALSHQTGFPNWRRETGNVLVFERVPGKAFGYSGEGYEYVARFAEKKTRIPFDTLAQTLVFDPLGMKDTAFTRQSWFDGRIAVPTDANGRALEPTIANKWLASDLLYTTPSDYAKFVLSVMNPKRLTTIIASERNRIQISRRSQMCSSRNAQSCPNDVGMGLGWEVSKFNDETFLMHTGMDDGVFTLGYLSLPGRTGTVIFTNSAHGPKIVLPILDRLGRDRVFVDFLRGQAG
jgi:CubicO group peptidase (beta-lactamase class C family)